MRLSSCGVAFFLAWLVFWLSRDGRPMGVGFREFAAVAGSNEEMENSADSVLLISGSIAIQVKS